MKPLSVAISILYVIFFAYALYTLYPLPKSNCYTFLSPKLNFTNSSSSEYSKCIKNYESAKSAHDIVSFVILSLVGIISVVGSQRLKSKPIKDGVLIGGALLLIYSSIAFWGRTGSVVHLFMLGLDLLAVSYAAMKYK